MKSMSLLVGLACLFAAGCQRDPASGAASTEQQPAGVALDSESAGSHSQTADRPQPPQDAVEPESASPVEPLTADEQPVSVQILDWDQTRSLVAENAGRVVVLDVWSTSCLPCMREFPHLVSLQRHYPDDVVCISLNTDYLGIRGKPPAYYKDVVLDFLRKHDATLQNVMSNVPADELYDVMGLPSIPAVYVFDRDGELARRFTDSPEYGDMGFTYVEHINPLVDELVARSPAAENAD